MQIIWCILWCNNRYQVYALLWKTIGYDGSTVCNTFGITDFVGSSPTYITFVPFVMWAVHLKRSPHSMQTQAENNVKWLKFRMLTCQHEGCPSWGGFHNTINNIFKIQTSYFHFLTFHIVFNLKNWTHIHLLASKWFCSIKFNTLFN